MKLTDKIKLFLIGITAVVTLESGCATTLNKDPLQLVIETNIRTKTGEYVGSLPGIKRLYDKKLCNTYPAFSMSDGQIETPNKVMVNYPEKLYFLTDCESFSHTTFFSDNQQDPYSEAYVMLGNQLLYFRRTSSGYESREINEAERKEFVEYTKALAVSLIDYVGKKAARKEIDSH